MKKLIKLGTVVSAVMAGVVLSATDNLFAASADKQLAKGIELYNKNKPDAAMDYFIDVMVNGTPEQAAEANKYVNSIHNQIGGIQSPVEVDVNYKEGEVKQLVNDTADQVKQDVQNQADAVAAGAQETQNRVAENVAAAQAAVAADVAAAQDAAAAQVAAAQDAASAQVAAAQEAVAIPVQETLDELNAGQQSLTQQIEANRLAAEAGVQNAPNDFGAPSVVAAGTTEMTVADALTQENQPQEGSVQDAEPFVPAADEPRSQSVMTTMGPATASSTFADLTTPEAIEARNLYTAQKLDSMTQAAIDKISAEKGVHLYMRDGKPDAIDVDNGVLFDNKGNFLTEALPLLNNIYELLALTQGAKYIILPPGSYTDDVTLAGMRQAAALDSYLVKRGISQGKLSYNMGLIDQEAPAQFANLKGLSIVFDYDGKFPTRLEKNDNNETAPLLSMAIVPQCHAIDRSLGEAYAIDFSVLETVNGIDNWVLQVVQHGRDGNFYIVRQLEGFSPVYHQILWNGRKGIIGPELPCGKYTIVLTATDLQGNKQTLRRRVVVKCSSQQSDSITDTCGVKKPEVIQKAAGELDYKAERLWKKPARVMGGTKAAAQATDTATQTAQEVSTSSNTASYTHKKTVTNIVTEDTSAPVTTTTTVSSSDAYYGDLPADPAINPYSMPYDELN